MTEKNAVHPNPSNDLADPHFFDESLPLEGDARYLLDDRAKLAVRMAWATSRPLLVVGEAGCGKTRLAQALAKAWGVPLFARTIHARTEAQDLFFHFDAIARLSDAQLRSALGALGPAIDAVKPKYCDPLKPSHYLRPGPLWWAINAPSAWRLNDGRPDPFKVIAPYGMPPEWSGGASVILIDEVDKGSDELAESLLELLDEKRFSVPWTGQEVLGDPKSEPFLLLTSNGARQLPAPFLRRCIVLAMQLPTDGLVDWLMKRGRLHFTASKIKDDALRRAAELIDEDRRSVSSKQRYRPGVAEYIDLCEAITELAANASAHEQIALIESLAPSVTSHKGEANRLQG
ncbi:AAA family ATPase [Lysobacter hankyongensis]|uniref:MoxR family ATPase n=1 Tax=Lysobacter hankyongensis TaxID=1176535 RepID=A0ABP9C7Y9_9GAMM